MLFSGRFLLNANTALPDQIAITSEKPMDIDESQRTNHRIPTNHCTSHEPKDDTMFTPILDLTPPAWFANARCVDGAGTLTSLFFSEDLSEIARAKAICGLCPSADHCLEVAVARREPWGVWGGELLMNGKVLSARRRRGRPPKIARPELVVDELGQVISA